jgi:hypothetical protein
MIQASLLALLEQEHVRDVTGLTAAKAPSKLHGHSTGSQSHVESCLEDMSDKSGHRDLSKDTRMSRHKDI